MTNLFGRRSKCVLILDFSTSGHHPTYVRWLLESKLENSAQVILASRKEMFSHPAIRSCATNFSAHEIRVTPELEARRNDVKPISLFRSSWEIGNLYRSTFAFLSKTRTIDFVVIPYLDDCLLGLAAPREPFGKTPWMTITMRTMFHFDCIGIV